MFLGNKTFGYNSDGSGKFTLRVAVFVPLRKRFIHTPTFREWKCWSLGNFSLERNLDHTLISNYFVAILRVHFL